MRSSRTLASAMLVAFGAQSALAHVPRSTAANTVARRNEATVTALSVVPSTRSADVVIRVSGSVAFKHFTMARPDKIVVDMNGATLGLPAAEGYDGVARGGIKGIRFSQFTKSVVRVVITLDSPHTYGVLQENGELHIAIDNAGDDFEPWMMGSAPTETRRAAAESRKSLDALADANVRRTINAPPENFASNVA